MSMRNCLLTAAVAAIMMFSAARAADLTEGMQTGTPDVKSAGPITFAPEGILLLGDFDSFAKLLLGRSAHAICAILHQQQFSFEPVQFCFPPTLSG